LEPYCIFDLSRIVIDRPQQYTVFMAGQKKKSTAKSNPKKRYGTIGTTQKVVGGIVLFAGMALLISLYLPKIYATIAPEPKINPIVLERGHFWIVIPKIRVDSPVMPAVTKDFLRRGVSHVADSGFPGEGKNCIIAGHNYDPAKWVPQTTFGLLYELKKGDDIYVANRGKEYHYVVESRTSLPADDPKLYEKTDHEQLTLLTCTPYKTTTQRTKVVALPAN